MAGNNKDILEEIKEIRQENKEMKEKLEVWVQNIKYLKITTLHQFKVLISTFEK